MKQDKPLDLNAIQKKGLSMLAPARARITVGMATCGLAKGAGKIFEALKYEIKKQKAWWGWGATAFAMPNPLLK